MEIRNSLIKSVVDEYASYDSGQDLVRDFLVFFARFEYALKRSGFLRARKDRSAEADWDTFAVSLRAKFNGSNPEIFDEAVEYLLKNPPHKQVVNAGHLSWQEPKLGNGEGRSEYILRLVRTVRNNLFHGGKFPNPIGPIAESARDRALRKHCLVILDECARMDEGVKRYFEVDA